MFVTEHCGNVERNVYHTMSTLNTRNLLPSSLHLCKRCQDLLCNVELDMIYCIRAFSNVPS